MSKTILLPLSNTLRILITEEHVKNNEDVRNVLIKRGIKPEDLPAAEDIKKLEREVKSEEKKLARSGIKRRKIIKNN